jgi:hypothetical protein
MIIVRPVPLNGAANNRSVQDIEIASQACKFYRLTPALNKR